MWAEMTLSFCLYACMYFSDMCGNTLMWVICKECVTWLHHFLSYLMMRAQLTHVSVVSWREWVPIFLMVELWIFILLIWGTYLYNISFKVWCIISLLQLNSISIAIDHHSSWNTRIVDNKRMCTYHNFVITVTREIIFMQGCHLCRPSTSLISE